ncbi:hypothetical protein [Sphingomonas sp. PAMC 26605]|uniref:hypothetical protein n=1 Tax=Sphingomonas sp. PAMC 26605 TaxID=1112214 RepID=UPI000561C219|nr:hypothetical protein [Sphingomonas sp. PAMC 26605]
MGEIWNRDINPPQQLMTTSGLDALIHNERIAAAFDTYERRANHWKRAFHVGGVITLVASVVGMGLVGYQAVLAPIAGPLPLAPVIGFFAGAVGIAATGFLLLGHPRERWLSARLGAERLRCFKFRLFLLLAHGAEADTLTSRIRQETDRTLARFDFQMGGGFAVLHYTPSSDESAVPPLAPGAATHPAWLDAAKTLYADLRINVQLQHFAARMEDRDAELRPMRRFGDLLFAAGLLLTIAQLLFDGAHWALGGTGISDAAAASMTFLSLLLFTASAALLLLERGRNVEVDRERYARYHAEIAAYADALPAADLAGFLTLIHDIERLCLCELRDFVRDMRGSSYLS